MRPFLLNILFMLNVFCFDEVQWAISNNYHLYVYKEDSPFYFVNKNNYIITPLKSLESLFDFNDSLFLESIGFGEGPIANKKKLVRVAQMKSYQLAAKNKDKLYYFSKDKPISFNKIINNKKWKWMDIDIASSQLVSIEAQSMVLGGYFSYSPKYYVLPNLGIGLQASVDFIQDENKNLVMLNDFMLCAFFSFHLLSVGISAGEQFIFSYQQKDMILGLMSSYKIQFQKIPILEEIFLRVYKVPGELNLYKIRMGVGLSF